MVYLFILLISLWLLSLHFIHSFRQHYLFPVLLSITSFLLFPNIAHSQTAAYHSSIAYFNDDAEEKISGPEVGIVYLASSVLEISERIDELRIIGLRFRNIPIPQDANILSAYITFTSFNNRKSITNFVISGEESINSEPFSSEYSNLSSRIKFSTQVNWNSVGVSLWIEGNSYQTSNIASILQKIIDQPNWNDKKNAMTLFIHGSGRLDAVSFDNNPKAAPVLSIKYAYPDIPVKANFGGRIELIMLILVIIATVARYGEARRSRVVPDKVIKYKET